MWISSILMTAIHTLHALSVPVIILRMAIHHVWLQSELVRLLNKHATRLFEWILRSICWHKLSYATTIMPSPFCTLSSNTNHGVPTF